MDSKATCHRALTATAFHRCNRDDLPHGFPAPCERLANRLQTMLTDFWPVRFEDRLPGGHGSSLSPSGERSFLLKFPISGSSAAAAGRRDNRLEHIERLHAYLTVGLVIGGYANDISGAELLAFSIDVEGNAVVCRSADEADGQTPPAYNQGLIC